MRSELNASLEERGIELSANDMLIKDAGSLSPSVIAAHTKALAAKARGGELMPEDFLGTVAPIFKLEMFGVDEVFPVINPPQAMIMGIGAGTLNTDAFFWIKCWP